MAPRIHATVIPPAAAAHGRNSWPRLADRQSVVSLPGYFGVQSDFADFSGRASAAQLPPPSDAAAAAAVSWLQGITPPEDAPTPLGIDALGNRTAAQPLHASGSANTAEMGRDRASFPPDRDFGLTLYAPCARFALLCCRVLTRPAACRPTDHTESFAFMRSLCELEDSLGDVLPAGLCGLAAFPDF